MNTLIQTIVASKGTNVEVVDLKEPVDAAIVRMNTQHVGSLLVVDGNCLVGILTERDLLVRVLAARRDPATTMVHEVMTRELVVIAPRNSVGEAMGIVTRRRLRHLPVVDEEGRICGVVSAGDLTAWLVQEQRQTIDDLHEYITR